MNSNNINHGDYVSVTEDLLPGKNSHGRTGFVVDTQGDGFHRTFTVRYNESAIGSLPEYFITFHLHYISFALHYICI